MAQLPVAVQQILGAFNPQTNQIVGITLSGESVYQNIPNALMTTTFGGVRTATSSATSTVITLGKVTQGDGAGATFVFTPTDTTTGCVCTGTSAGTVLTVVAVQSGTIVNGMTVSSATTGLPLATITSFGTGAGGTGTYNLSGTVTQTALATFLIDNNSTVLVSADGSRWHLNGTTSLITTFNAPSGNPAITLTTPSYTFGNTTDNPSYAFVGTGSLAVTGPFAAANTSLTVNANGTTLLAPNGGTTSLTVTNPGGGGTTAEVIQSTNHGLQINAGSGAADTSLFVGNAAANTVMMRVNGDGSGFLGATATGSHNMSWDTSGHFTFNAPLGGGNTVFIAGNSVLSNGASSTITGFGTVANAQVDMTPDTGQFTGTLTGCTTSPTAVIVWRKMGNFASMFIPGVTGTSNATTFTITGSIPASIVPATTPKWIACNLLLNNGALASGGILTVATGVITFGFNLTSGSWTAAGSKGISSGIMFTYALD